MHRRSGRFCDVVDVEYQATSTLQSKFEGCRKVLLSTRAHIFDRRRKIRLSHSRVWREPALGLDSWLCASQKPAARVLGSGRTIFHCPRRVGWARALVDAGTLETAMLEQRDRALV